MGNKLYQKDSFVVISDFHSCDWPIEKIKNHYLNEYEKIYILGDCTDRGAYNDGTGGLDLLFKVKELSEQYPGRVIYIPGNHDTFVYDYGVYKSDEAALNMSYNHGMQTIVDIDKLRQDNPKKLRELMAWLCTLPLQREHFKDGQRYVLAHALFDEKLFQRNKTFSLIDYNRRGGNSGEYQSLLWFRKDSDSYDKTKLPRKDSIMIVGHTPEHSRKGLNLDLENAYGETVKVICVDGGITHGAPMLKFDGGTCPQKTVAGVHCCTSQILAGIANTQNNPPIKRTMSTYEVETTFTKQLLKLIGKSPNSNEALLNFFKITVGVREDKFGDIYDKLREPEINEYLSNQMLYYATRNNAFDYSSERARSNSVFKSIKEMLSKTALDYIIYCLIKKYGDKRQVANNLNAYLTTNDLEYITESVGRARSIASKFSPRDFMDVIQHSNHPKLTDYINYELGNVYKKI